MLIGFTVVAGAGLALGLVRIANARGPARARHLYAVALGVAALLYVGFALVGRASARWMGLEVLGLVLYGGVAWIGLRRWLPAVALGWVAHVGWDLVLHRAGPGAAYTPVWYPWLCVGFDLVVAAAILRQPVATPGRLPAGQPAA